MKGKIDLSTVGTVYKAPRNLESSPEEKILERHKEHLLESGRWENFAAKVDLTQDYHFVHHRHTDLDYQYNIDRYSRYLWKHYETKKYQEDYSKGSKIFGSKSPSKYLDTFSDVPTPKRIMRSTSTSRYVSPPYAPEGYESPAFTDRKRTEDAEKSVERPRSKSPNQQQISPSNSSASKKNEVLSKSVLSGRRNREERQKEKDISPTSSENKNLFGFDESKIPHNQRRGREERPAHGKDDGDNVPNNSRSDEKTNQPNLYEHHKDLIDIDMKNEFEKYMKTKLNGSAEANNSKDNISKGNQSKVNISKDEGSKNNSADKKIAEDIRQSREDQDEPNPSPVSIRPFNIETKPVAEERFLDQEYDNYTQSKLKEIKTIYNESQTNVSNQNKQTKAAIQNLNGIKSTKNFEKYMSKITYKTYTPYSDRKKAENNKTPQTSKKTNAKPTTEFNTIKKTYLENRDIPTEKKEYNQVVAHHETKVDGMKAPRRETFGVDVIQLEECKPENDAKLTPTSNNAWVEEINQPAKTPSPEEIEAKKLQDQLDDESKFRTEFRDMLDHFRNFEDLYIKMKRTLPPTEATNKVIELSIAFVSAYCTLKGTSKN